MPISNVTADRGQEEVSKETIVIIDDELLSQDCLAEAMRGALPSTTILGVSTIRELHQIGGPATVLVLLKVKSQPITHYPLANDIKTIGQYCPKTPVVLISACADAASIGEAISAGAKGVIPVTASFRIAVAALQLVMAGGTYYPHPVNGSLKLFDGALEMAHVMAGASPSVLSLDPSNPLLSSVKQTIDMPKVETNGCSTIFTTREAEVLAALQRGRSNKWIAHQLNLSENTIKVHIQHIMRKLNATNRTEAVVLSQNLLSDADQRPPREVPQA